MSDRIAVMHAGRVEQLGTPEDLYERPRTRFVADFIGTTNLLAGTVESVDGDHAFVRLASSDGCIVDRADLVVGRSVELSVRPEAIQLRPSNGTGEAPPPIAGTVEQAAYLGNIVQYLVRTAGGLSITALAPKTGPRIPIGGAVDISWSPGDALVLAEHVDTQEEVPA